MRMFWIFVVAALALIAVANVAAGFVGGGAVIGLVAYLLWRKFIAPTPSAS